MKYPEIRYFRGRKGVLTNRFFSLSSAERATLTLSLTKTWADCLHFLMQAKGPEKTPSSCHYSAPQVQRSRLAPTEPVCCGPTHRSLRSHPLSLDVPRRSPNRPSHLGLHGFDLVTEVAGESSPAAMHLARRRVKSSYEDPNRRLAISSLLLVKHHGGLEDRCVCQFRQPGRSRSRRRLLSRWSRRAGPLPSNKKKPRGRKEP